MAHLSLALRQRVLICALVLLALANLKCMAQESTADLSEVPLEQLGTIKVYSASRHLQSAEDAPSSVTVITAAEIQQHGYRTLADVLQTVRGFFVTNDRNYSSLGVKDLPAPATTTRGSCYSWTATASTTMSTTKP